MHRQMICAASHGAVDRTLVNLAASRTGSAEGRCNCLFLGVSRLNHFRDILGNGLAIFSFE
jgi:hypothetical protein